MKYIDTIKQWERVRIDFERSGLSVNEYCELNKINRATFYRNMKSLKELGTINHDFDINELPKSIIIYVNGNKLEIDPTLDNTTLGRIIKLCCK